jgi:hypothetical protein
LNPIVGIGRHRLLCGDLTLGVLERLMRDDDGAPVLADVVYVDPPWGPGNQQYWHTMNARGSVPRTPWPDFLAALCSACRTYRKPSAPVFVEMGLRWVAELDAAMAAVGLAVTRRWSITYGPKAKPLPNSLSLYGAQPTIDMVLPSPPHGPPVTRWMLAATVRPGAIVLDPCTGKGMTARFTHEFGGCFRGLELNPRRLEAAAAWLHRHNDREARR